MVYLLVALGCLFWLIPLAAGATVLREYGYSGDLIVLIGVPIAMIALTVLVGRLARAMR